MHEVEDFLEYFRRIRMHEVEDFLEVFQEVFHEIFKNLKSETSISFNTLRFVY